MGLRWFRKSVGPVQEWLYDPCMHESVVHGEAVPCIPDTQRHLTMRTPRLRQHIPATLRTVLADFAEDAALLPFIGIGFHFV